VASLIPHRPPVLLLFAQGKSPLSKWATFVDALCKQVETHIGSDMTNTMVPA